MAHPAILDVNGSRPENQRSRHYPGYPGSHESNSPAAHKAHSAALGLRNELVRRRAELERELQTINQHLARLNAESFRR